MAWASTDIVLILLLVPSIVASALSFPVQRKAIAAIAVRVRDIYEQSASEAVGMTALLFVLGLLGAWIALGVSAQLMGHYHGRKAIGEGKMGVRAVRALGEWWLFVVRTDDGRNFLYDVKGKRGRQVRDEQIDELRDFNYLYQVPERLPKPNEGRGNQ